MIHHQLGDSRVTKERGLALLVQNFRAEHIALDMRCTSINKWNDILLLECSGTGHHGPLHFHKLGVHAEDPCAQVQMPAEHNGFAGAESHPSFLLTAITRTGSYNHCRGAEGIYSLGVGALIWRNVRRWPSSLSCVKHVKAMTGIYDLEMRMGRIARPLADHGTISCQLLTVG